MNFTFDENYFLPEERDGFFVSECMKRYWAASLICLKDFDEFCQRHGLRWASAYGTLLGAIRHKGYIPWDDDIDIMMPREDYDIFYEKRAELPGNYVVDKLESERHDYGGMTVINNHTGVSFDEAILEKYCCCPFRAGIDIYVYDYIPAKKIDDDKWRLDILKTLKELQTVRDNEPDNMEKRFELSKRCEEISRRFVNRKEESTELCRFITYAQWNCRPVLKKEWLSSIIDLPFETGTVKGFPLEIADPFLSCTVDQNWRIPSRSGAAHSYPLYKEDLKRSVRFLNDGGISMKTLPPFLSYLRTEADLYNIDYS